MLQVKIQYLICIEKSNDVTMCQYVPMHVLYGPGQLEQYLSTPNFR